jgi:hypothetical protein
MKRVNSFVSKEQHMTAPPVSSKNITRRIVLEFERGGRLIADLLDEDAPETAQALWDCLPFRDLCEHAKFSGFMISVRPDLPSINKPENSRSIGVIPGQILFNPHLNNQTWHKRELAIVYGIAVMRDSFGSAPSNLVANISSGVDELREIGIRIHQEGREYLEIKRYTED